MGLPHYAIERDPMTAAAARRDPHFCPVCLKPGRWVAWRFLPNGEKGPPRCYCRTMHDAGPDVYAYDPETKTFLRRKEG